MAYGCRIRWSVEQRGPSGEKVGAASTVTTAGPAVTKVALVTGGAKRIGQAIAIHLHQLGFDIALHYCSSTEKATALADELLGLRINSCQLFQADLGDQKQLCALTAALCERYSSLDLLVNNASSFMPTPIGDCVTKQFDDLLDANLRGPYFLIQGLLPLMQSRGASIVNLTDVNIDRPLHHYSAYTAAKAGLASLTRSLAVELAPHIRVNGIAPGVILWPEESGTFDAAMREKAIENAPLKRMGNPQDIARTVEFLACNAPFITGQIIAVDGGWSLVG